MTRDPVLRRGLRVDEVSGTVRSAHGDSVPEKRLHAAHDRRPPRGHQSASGTTSMLGRLKQHG